MRTSALLSSLHIASGNLLYLLTVLFFPYSLVLNGVKPNQIWQIVLRTRGGIGPHWVARKIARMHGTPNYVGENGNVVTKKP